MVWKGKKFLSFTNRNFLKWQSGAFWWKERYSIHVFWWFGRENIGSIYTQIFWNDYRMLMHLVKGKTSFWCILMNLGKGIIFNICIQKHRMVKWILLHGERKNLAFHVCWCTRDVNSYFLLYTYGTSLWKSIFYTIYIFDIF